MGLLRVTYDESQKHDDTSQHRKSNSARSLRVWFSDDSPRLRSVLMPEYPQSRVGELVSSHELL